MNRRQFLGATGALVGASALARSGRSQTARDGAKRPNILPETETEIALPDATGNGEI